MCLLKMNQTRFSIGTRCRSISSLPDSIEQGGYAISHRSISFFSKVFSPRFTLRTGIRTPTIRHIASLAYQPHSTTYTLHLHGGKRCVQRGKAKMACVRLPFPRLSAGLRKAAALILSARLRIALYVIILSLLDDSAC